MNYDEYLHLVKPIIFVDSIFYCTQKLFNNNIGKSLIVTSALILTLSSEHLNLIGLCCFYINMADIICI